MATKKTDTKQHNKKEPAKKTITRKKAAPKKPQISAAEAKTAMNKKALLNALEKSLGVVTTACKAAGLNRSTFYTYYKEDQDFKNQVDELENMALDFAESQLHAQIKDGSTAATIFYLKTKGKKRGYVERQEVTGADGKDLNQPDLSKYSTKELKELIDKEDKNKDQ